MSSRTLPTNFHPVAYTLTFALEPARHARLMGILRDAGAVMTVLSLVGIGCVLPFCG